MAPQRAEATFNILSLNDDVLLKIVGKLVPCTLASLSCTCSRMNALACSDGIWEKLCLQRWKSPNLGMLGLQSVTAERERCSITMQVSRSSSVCDSISTQTGVAAISASGRHGSRPGQTDQRQNCASASSTDLSTPVVTGVPEHCSITSLPCPAPANPTVLGTAGDASTSEQQLSQSFPNSTEDSPFPSTSQSDACHIVKRDRSVKSLFCSSNGWREGGFALKDLKPESDFISALHCRQTADEGLSISCATSATLEVWNLYPWNKPDAYGDQDTIYKAHYTCDVPQDHFSVYSVVQHSPGHFIAGNSIGSLLFFHQIDDSLSHIHTHTLPVPTSPIVDLYVEPDSSFLASLHDSTFCMSPTDSPRNCLKWFDVEACKELGKFTDCLDSYEVMCMCPSKGASGGMDLVAGAVHGEFCMACFRSGIPSLCQHKPQAQSAALCVFDLRSQRGMVQRYSLHQRSLYPAIRSARDYFLFTSHAGQPLGVWDRRWMSMPVYTQEHLGNFPMPAMAEGLALPAPVRPGAHQGLWLDCDADVLIGRAENGMMWMWDLSDILGWTRDSHTSQPWMTSAEPATDAADSAPSSTTRSVWALGLGALPCETSLPITWAPNITTTATLVCQVADSVEAVDKVVVGCLATKDRGRRRREE